MKLPFFSRKPKDAVSTEITPENEAGQTVSFLLKNLEAQNEFWVLKAKKTTLLWSGACLLGFSGLTLVVWLTIH